MAPPGAAAAAKEKGNQAFKLGDHPLAIAHYTTAIALDPSEFTYPLNRSQTYLKQGVRFRFLAPFCVPLTLSLYAKKWAEAEKDASTTLALMPGNAKALFRRGLARKERGNERGAREGELLGVCVRVGADGVAEQTSRQRGRQELATRW